MALRFAAVAALACSAACGFPAPQFQCPPNAGELAYQMVESTIARGQGIAATNASTSLIELGIFQQALREAIASTNDTRQKQRWGDYLQKSVFSEISTLSDATADAGLPLDRLSIGTRMIYQYQDIRNDSLLLTIDALKASVDLQQRNANGGLWYYANSNNLSAYHNLSYSDGMFSYPAFAILSANITDSVDSFGTAAALEQIQILYDICKTQSGLVVHGYDASKDHAWADPETGASPVVWGRSLAWYTLGTLNALEVIHPEHPGNVFSAMRHILESVLTAQLAASDRSLQMAGKFGVWQVVDYPDATFNGHKNFIEASASFMTVYSLLRSSRLEFAFDHRAKPTAIGIYQNVLREFLIRDGNGTLSFNGTSSVASLSGDVDFEYYVTRPTVLNSLIGTSAFILASLEVEKLCSEVY